MSIDEKQLAASQAWGDGLIAISKAFDTEDTEAARALAVAVFGRFIRSLSSARSYSNRPYRIWSSNLFAPTKTVHSPILSAMMTPIRKMAVSLKGWREVTSQTAACRVDGDVAMWMGWVDFTDGDGAACASIKAGAIKKRSTAH